MLKSYKIIKNIINIFKLNTLSIHIIHVMSCPIDVSNTNSTFNKRLGGS